MRLFGTQERNMQNGDSTMHKLARPTTSRRFMLHGTPDAHSCKSFAKRAFLGNLKYNLYIPEDIPHPSIL